jgi:hypothetical protein
MSKLKCRVIVLFEEVLVVLFFIGRHCEFVIYIVTGSVFKILFRLLGQFLIQKIERNVYRTYPLTLFTVYTSAG